MLVVSCGKDYDFLVVHGCLLKFWCEMVNAINMQCHAANLYHVFLGFLSYDICLLKTFLDLILLFSPCYFILKRSSMFICTTRHIPEYHGATNFYKLAFWSNFLPLIENRN